jgi:hypothetical protein
MDDSSSSELEFNELPEKLAEERCELLITLMV